MPSISTPEMPPRLALAPIADSEAVQVSRRDVPSVPRRAIVIKNHSGAEVTLADLKARYMPPCTITPPAVIAVKIETEEAHAKRVASTEKPVPQGLPKLMAEKMDKRREEDLEQEGHQEVERPPPASSLPTDAVGLSPYSLPGRQASVDPIITPEPTGYTIIDDTSSASVPNSTRPSAATTSQPMSTASDDPGRSREVPPKASKSSRKRTQTAPAIAVSTKSRSHEDLDNAPLDTAVSSSSTLVSTELPSSSISCPAFLPSSAGSAPQLPSRLAHSPIPAQTEIKRRYAQRVQLLTIRQTHQRIMDMHDELQSRHEETMRTFEREKVQMKKLMAASMELLEQADLLIEREEKSWEDEEQEFMGAARQEHEPRDQTIEVEAPTVEEQVRERLHNLKERAEERTRKKAEEQEYEAARHGESEKEAEQPEEDEGQGAEQPAKDEGEEVEHSQAYEGEEAEQFQAYEGDEAEYPDRDDGEQPKDSAAAAGGDYIKQEPDFASALAAIRPIQNLKSIKYPKGIKRPSAKLNKNSEPGKFRYDREFLLQFKLICKKKPKFPFPLDDFGLGPASYNAAVSREQYGRRPDWRYMGSLTPHYTDWAFGPDDFQQPGFNTGQWPAYNTLVGWPYGYHGGGFAPGKKKFADQYYGAY